MINSRHTSGSSTLDRGGSPVGQAVQPQRHPDDLTSLLRYHARKMAMMNKSSHALAERRRRRRRER